MKTLGLLLITASFLAGSLVASQTKENEVNWSWFWPAVAVGVAGVVLARVAARGRARQADSLRENFGAVAASIQSIHRKVDELDRDKEALHVYDVYPRIDELFPDDLNTFVEARESIAHLHGLKAYAEVMNAFAAGERYLNRVWSASLDGYVDEVREYLGRSREQFAEAQRLVAGLGPEPR